MPLFQYSIPKYAWRNEFWFISYYHGMLLHHSGLKRYWKILLVVMVITCESIEFITRGLRPLVINSILSIVITITTRDIFQYLLPGVDQLLNCHVYLNFHFVLNYLSYWGAIGLICSLNFNQPSSPTFFRFFFFLKKNSLVLEILNHCPVQFRKLKCATKKEQLY